MTSTAPRTTRIVSLLTGVMAALVALMMLSSPALASNGKGKGHGKDKAQGSGSDHDGDAGNTAGTTTEDNDTNDGGTPNNVVDDGDNAHPSGKDRSVEHGKSSSNPNQGKSESDPDGNGNGGYDKPGGSGGVDQADQDGNNGCGNDDDFEDDNNGNCGGKRVKSNPPVIEDDCDKTMPGNQKDCTPVVKGEDIVGPDRLDEPDRRDEVLGSRIERTLPATEVAAARSPLGEVFPFTGAGLGVFLAAAAGLMIAGLALLKVRKA